MDRIEVTVTEMDAGGRLDRFLAEACQLSRATAQALIRQGHVLYNDGPAGKSMILKKGDVLAVTVPPPVEGELVAQDIPLDVVYEDGHLLVVNKPKGMVVHPAAGNPDGTLVNALMYHCGDSLSGIGGEIRPGIVHRIDKDTSGLLVVAKDDTTHYQLSEQFACHSITRMYEAVAGGGGFREDSGIVDAPLGRDKRDRKKIAVSGASDAKHAVTHWNVIGRYGAYTHLGLQLETGRTHQIRVHMAYLGRPLVGDTVYGQQKPEFGIQGQTLHARRLGFIHPATKEYVEFDSPLPDYFTKLLGRLEREYGQ